MAAVAEDPSLVKVYFIKIHSALYPLSTYFVKTESKWKSLKLQHRYKKNFESKQIDQTKEPTANWPRGSNLIYIFIWLCDLVSPLVLIFRTSRRKVNLFGYIWVFQNNSFNTTLIKEVKIKNNEDFNPSCSLLLFVVSPPSNRFL